MLIYSNMPYVGWGMCMSPLILGVLFVVYKS